jgi:hypothetical protein
VRAEAQTGTWNGINSELIQKQCFPSFRSISRHRVEEMDLRRSLPSDCAQYNNYIGPAGSTALAKALEQLTRLETLELVSLSKFATVIVSNCAAIVSLSTNLFEPFPRR